MQFPCFYLLLLSCFYKLSQIALIASSIFAMIEFLDLCLQFDYNNDLSVAQSAICSWLVALLIMRFSLFT